jgi:hypothetical protein
LRGSHMTLFLRVRGKRRQQHLRHYPDQSNPTDIRISIS